MTFLFASSGTLYDGAIFASSLYVIFSPLLSSVLYAFSFAYNGKYTTFPGNKVDRRDLSCLIYYVVPCFFNNKIVLFLILIYIY